MSDFSPSDTELAILQRLQRAISITESIGLPHNAELARELHVERSTISNAMKRLKENRFIDSQRRPTREGIDLLMTYRRVIPVSLPIVGEVQAGRRKGDELAVYISTKQELGSENAKRITIPTSSDPSNTVVLSVVGDSMIYENILDGDYVLVELFSDNEWPKVGELIITRYVPRANHGGPELWNEIDDTPSEEDYEGPTLKYYYKNGDRYRLSVRKGHETHGHTINASAIAPIGRVIGVYRSLS